jgi:hypothetical protein
VAGAGAPAAALRELADLYTHRANVRGLAIELAIRSLARSDDEAARAVRAVDRERLRQVAQLFAALGWPAADAQARAILFYSYLFGQSLLDAQVVPASGARRCDPRADQGGAVGWAKARSPHVGLSTRDDAAPCPPFTLWWARRASARLCPPYFNPNHNVAIVRNEKKPTMSVTVVTNGLEATAGSRPSR